MEADLFQRYEVKNENGELKIYLYLSPGLEEFSAELDQVRQTMRTSLKQSAKAFVKDKFPKVSRATIVVMAGAMLLSVIPIGKAEAHVADFNMTYLYFGNTQSYISQIDRTKGNMNLVSPSYFDINADGSLKLTTQFDPYFVNEMHKRGIKVVPFLSNHWDRNVGRAALQNRDKISTQIADFITKNNLDGVQIDIENVTEIDRENYTDLVRQLRAKLPKDKEVSVAVAANPNGWTKGWHGSYDYKELAKYSNYLMIMAYDESYTGGPEGPVASSPWVERSIQYALNQGIASDKIVLGVPFYGRYWKEGAATGGDGISNRRVDEMLAKYGGTVVFDEKAKSPKATITIKSTDTPMVIAGKTLGAGTYHIWYENSESIKAKIDLVHKYDLKGTGSWSLGQENPVIWDEYKVWMTTHNVIAQGPIADMPASSEQPKALYPTYTVQSGDSLWKIATQYGISVNQLKEYNYLTSDTIKVGQVLYIAPPPTQTPDITPPGTNETKVIPVAPSPAPKQAPAPVATKTTPAPVVKKPAAAPVKTVSLVGKVMVPKASKTYMRSGATSTNKIVKTLTTKDEVKILQEYTDKKKVKWVKVQSKSTTGWLMYSQLKEKPVVVPILKVGSNGTAVTDLQKKLKQTGYYKGSLNGKFDTATKTAVMNFQRKYKLKVDGIAGSATIGKLNTIVKK